MSGVGEQLPVFPLGTVLFPDGRLSLRIFEPRYVDMVSRCSREGIGFVVAAIKQGNEAGEPAIPHTVGTEVRIVDWGKDDRGLLTIECLGVSKVSIDDTWLLQDGLRMAQIKRLPPEPQLSVPEQHMALWGLLTQWGVQVSALEQRNAAWLSARLVESLPLPLELKQKLLCLSDPLQRLAEISQLAVGVLKA